METVLALLPDGLSLFSAGLLVVAAFFTAALTAAFGIGGGVALLAILASMVPVAVLIPVHGVVQLGANTGRFLVQIRQVVWPLLGIFSFGALLGAVIGSNLVVTLPEALLKSIVGFFVLFSVWGGKSGGTPKGRKGGALGLALGGGLATILTMFVGATGPFVAALLAPRLDDRRNYGATHAAAMVMQHGLKVIAFGFLGFAFGAWVPVMVAMVVSGFLGTLLGTKLLHVLPEKAFRQAFKIVLTILAIQLIASAGWSWLR